MLIARMKPKLPECRKRGKAMPEDIVQQIKERMHVDPAFRHNLLASPWRALQAYPLTEEEKQQFVAPNFSWMIENKLAGVSYPRSEDAIALLRKLGVLALLNLSEEPLPLDLQSLVPAARGASPCGRFYRTNSRSGRASPRHH
jgi:hypothetical protein